MSLLLRATNRSTSSSRSGSNPLTFSALALLLSRDGILLPSLLPAVFLVFAGFVRPGIVHVNSTRDSEPTRAGNQSEPRRAALVTMTVNLPLGDSEVTNQPRSLRPGTPPLHKGAAPLPNRSRTQPEYRALAFFKLKPLRLPLSAAAASVSDSSSSWPQPVRHIMVAL